MEKRIKTKRVNFWSYPDLFEAFQKACEKEHRTASQTLNALMEEYVKKMEESKD